MVMCVPRRGECLYVSGRVVRLSYGYGPPDVRVPNEKIKSHRFSGLASRCVETEWFDPNIKRTNRDAPSPSFLQEK